jgi:serine protease Do
MGKQRTGTDNCVTGFAFRLAGDAAMICLSSRPQASAACPTATAARLARRRARAWLLAAALATAAAVLAAPPAAAQPASGGAPAGPTIVPFQPMTPGARPLSPRRAAGTPVAELAPVLLDTVVRVEAKVPGDAMSAESLGPRRVGTGVLLDRTTVLTIGYLLLEADEVEVVTATGKRIPASVAGYDHQSGLGLVQTALPLEDARPIELGDSDAIAEMQRVLTLGHGEPAPTELTVVSRKDFAGRWEYLLEKAIFTFPPVNNWSGAALFGPDGRLVGVGSLLVNDAASERRGVPGNLFVPVNALKPILADLLANGRRSGPAQPWLGVTTEVVQGNLIVSKVTKDGPADRAGLVAGDVILSVGTDKVSNQSDFYRNVWKLGPAGVTVPLRVLKSGDVQEVSVQSIDRMAMLRKPKGV